MPERKLLAIKKREWVYGAVIVLFIAAFSLTMNLQGWKSRIPAFDLLTYIYGVRNFTETGTILQHGDTGSYGSYKPPGTAWLMLPSTLVFKDPRLSEYVGTGFLHLATLAGLFILARIFFGFPCAVVATLLYGLSEHSYFFAGSLWPNGRPDFYIWIVLFTGLWVMRKEARYLAAALGVWGIGMNVDMGITPAFFILPAAWLIYRPPIHFKPILFTAAIVMIIWSPYLWFETSRGFADIRSQLLQQHIFPKNNRVTWCDPNVTLKQYAVVSNTAALKQEQTSAPQDPNTSTLHKLWNEGQAIKEKAQSNFKATSPISGASALLLLLTLCSLLILYLPGAANNMTGFQTRRPFLRQRVILLAVGLTLSGLLISIFLLVYLASREGAGAGPRVLFLYKIQKILLLTGAALLFGYGIVNITNHYLIRFGIQVQTTVEAEQRRLLVISLVIPWFLTLILAEPGKPERFWWLWPMQSLFLAAFFAWILPRLHLHKGIIWAGQVAVVLLIAGNSFLFSKLDAWNRTGWAGQDAAEIQVVDIIADQVKREGRDHVAIGYHTFIYPFMAEYNITNPIYKVGAEFDMLLLYRHGITNTDRCAEGISTTDEYRIVETKPKSPDWSPKSYIAVPLDEHFKITSQVNTYSVYHRE